MKSTEAWVERAHRSIEPSCPLRRRSLFRRRATTTPTAIASSTPRDGEAFLQQAAGALQFPVFPSDRDRLTSSLLFRAAATATLDSCRLLGVRSVGVDYGLVRTGIAVTVGYDPMPVDILTNLNATEVAEQVVRYTKTVSATRLIVGLPLHKNGTVAEQTNLTLAFAQELAQFTLRQMGPDVPVLLWDERYTSKEAAARAHSRHPGRYLYGSLDADAACIILENYYHDNGVGALGVLVQEDVRRVCIDEYERRQWNEQAAVLAAADERERKIQRRRESIAHCMKLEEDRNAINVVLSSKKKKRKKKR
jgi:putative holliday junction resolvase